MRVVHAGGGGSDNRHDNRHDNRTHAEFVCCKICRSRSTSARTRIRRSAIGNWSQIIGRTPSLYFQSSVSMPPSPSTSNHTPHHVLHTAPNRAGWKNTNGPLHALYCVLGCRVQKCGSITGWGKRRLVISSWTPLSWPLPSLLLPPVFPKPQPRDSPPTLDLVEGSEGVESKERRAEENGMG